MVSGGVLALIVAATVGTNAATDGFFAAFAVYSTVVAFGQSARTTIVARMLEDSTRFGAFDRYLGAGAMLFVVVAIAFGPLGGPVAGTLTGGLPPEARQTAETALLLFIPASGLQLFAALGAAMLGALEDFLWAGAAFLIGSLSSIAAFVALRPSLGTDALATAILLGSVVSAALVAAALVRDGWRPAAATFTAPRDAARAASVLVISSVSFLLAQLGFLVTLGIGARLGVGVITVYSYAYMAMGLAQAIFVSSVPMVLAAPLARTWDRTAASLLPHHLAVLRAGMLLVVPVLAAAALVGADVAGFVLREFTDQQSDAGRGTLPHPVAERRLGAGQHGPVCRPGGRRPVCRARGGHSRGRRRPDRRRPRRRSNGEHLAARRRRADQHGSHGCGDPVDDLARATRPWPVQRSWRILALFLAGGAVTFGTPYLLAVLANVPAARLVGTRLPERRCTPDASPGCPPSARLPSA